ncbi:hypothetical protein J6590_089400, partial [Homalodisca vitripennis]
ISLLEISSGQCGFAAAHLKPINRLTILLASRELHFANIQPKSRPIKYMTFTPQLSLGVLYFSSDGGYLSLSDAGVIAIRSPVSVTSNVVS